MCHCGLPEYVYARVSSVAFPLDLLVSKVHADLKTYWLDTMVVALRFIVSLVLMVSYYSINSIVSASTDLTLARDSCASNPQTYTSPTDGVIESGTPDTNSN